MSPIHVLLDKSVGSDLLGHIFLKKETKKHISKKTKNVKREKLVSKSNIPEKNRVTKPTNAT
jgi:hypothetical protein